MKRELALTIRPGAKGSLWRTARRPDRLVVRAFSKTDLIDPIPRTDACPYRRSSPLSISGNHPVHDIDNKYLFGSVCPFLNEQPVSTRLYHFQKGSR